MSRRRFTSASATEGHPYAIAGPAGGTIPDAPLPPAETR